MERGKENRKIFTYDEVDSRSIRWGDSSFSSVTPIALPTSDSENSEGDLFEGAVQCFKSAYEAWEHL